MVAAPVLPFITEEIYQRLVAAVDPDAPVSVHHTDYPSADPAVIDDDLETSMDVVRKVVTLGRGLRKREQVRVRQPLSTLTVITRDAGAAAAVESHTDLISEEMNVKVVAVERDESHLVHLSAKANFKVLGPRFGKRVKDVAAAIADLDHETVDRLIDGHSVEVGGDEITLDDVTIARDPRPGVIVAGEASFSVALDTELTDALRHEGVAREIIKAVQGLRRAADFDVSDRIDVRWHSDDDGFRHVLGLHETLIAGEVLATRIERSADLLGEPVSIDGREIWLSVTATD